MKPAPEGANRLARLALLGLVLVLIHQTVMGNRVFFERDIAPIWVPQIQALVRAVAAGSLPLWDPLTSFGQPILGHSDTQVLYPPTWLALVLDPWTYYTLFVFGHLLLAGWASQSLGRQLGLSAFAAFSAAALWIASGPLISLIGLWHHFAGASWIALVFLSVDSLLDRPDRRRTMICVVCFTGQALAGSADVCALTALAVGGWTVLRLLRERSAGGVGWGALARLCLAALLACGLTAPVWAASLELVLRSSRQSLSEAVRTYWSVHFLGLPELFVRGLWHDLPLSDWLSALLFESREPFLASIYVGLPSLALVGAALAEKRHSARGYLMLCSFIAVWLALGRHTPVFDWLSVVLPPLRILRYPVKTLVGFAFFWAFLAGCGVESLLRNRPAQRRWLLLVVGPVSILLLLSVAGWTIASFWPQTVASAVLSPNVPMSSRLLALRPAVHSLAVASAVATLTVLLALGTWTRFRRLAVLALTGLAVAELALAHSTLNRTAPAALYGYRPEALSRLGRSPRVYVYDYHQTAAARRYLKRTAAYVPVRWPRDWDFSQSRALAMQMYLVPSTAGRWGVSSAFEIDYRGLYPAWLRRLTALLREVEGTPAHLRLLQLGGVTHVIALHTAGLENLTPLATADGLFPEPIRIFAVPLSLPRAYVVSGARVLSDTEAAEALLDPRFSALKEVVLADGEPAAILPSFVGTSRIVDDRPNRVHLEADLGSDGYVVLLDSFDPGWQAWVDERPSVALRANLAFRAVRVPAGHHTIDWIYRPRGFVVGRCVATLTIALAIVGCLLGRRFRGAGSLPDESDPRSPGPHPPPSPPERSAWSRGLVSP